MTEISSCPRCQKFGGTCPSRLNGPGAYGSRGEDPARPNTWGTPSYADILWRRTTNFSVVTHLPEGRFRGSGSPTPRGRGSSAPNFHTSTRPNAHMVWCRMTKIGYGNTCGDWRVFRGQPHSHPKQQSPELPNFGVLPMCLNTPSGRTTKFGDGRVLEGQGQPRWLHIAQMRHTICQR